MSMLMEEAPAANEAWAADESVGQWFVLRTKSRQEKILANDLSARGIGHFLPTMIQTRLYAGRRARVEVPLFPGYLFLKGDVEQAYEADRTRRVAQIIRVTDQQRMNRELANIHLALGNNAALDPFPYLRAGVRVEVRDGPFRGLQGLVESRTSSDRLILQIDTLGQAVGLEIDGALLETI